MKYLTYTTIFLGLLVPAITSAHVLETNNTVGVVIHVDPDDDPIVGQPATFFLDFKDRENKFKLEQCDCKVSITKDSKEVFNLPLTTSSFSFIFPGKGAYQIKVIGKPPKEDEDLFKPFTINHDLQITREAPAKKANSWLTTHTLHLVAAVGVVIYALFLLAKEKVSKSKK